jgi:hypothetical protein
MVAQGTLELRRCSICTRPVWWWPAHFDPAGAPVCARAMDPDAGDPDVESCFARMFLAVN